VAEQTSTEIVRREEGAPALARYEDFDQGIPVERIVARVEKIREVQSRVMKADHHYGVIPGTGGKPTLLKPGAELLSLTFQLAPKFKTDERWDGDHLECVVTCSLVHIPTGTEVGEGVGSCTTKEVKYAFRKGERVCPSCSKPAIIKGKEEYGGGWLCFAKKGGCGAKFGDKDPAIIGQETGRIANPDLPDLYNTVRKMACKRAHVAAVLFVTCASEIFTQDVEDMADKGHADYAGGGYGYDDAPPANQKRQQSAPRTQQRNGGQQRGNTQDHPPPAQQGSGGESQDFANISKLIREATTVALLNEIVPELQLARDEQSITIDEYRALREAHSARATELRGQSRQSA